MKRYVVEKDFEYKGFQCSVILQSLGHRCGYVNLESKEKSKFFGVDYDNIPIDVHGCLTYSDCKLVDHEDGYWIGWDYAHYMDGKDYEALVKNFSDDEEQRKQIALLKSIDERFETNYGHIYSLDEVVADCKSVADQIIKLESEDK